MMVMVPLNSNRVCWKFAVDHPGQFGFLIGPSYFSSGRLDKGVPIALDNDAYKAFRNNEPWNEQLYFDMLNHISNAGLKPLWVLVPDVVRDREATLLNWKRYAPRVKEYGFPIGFAAQDGMICSDVPDDAELVFVGGSTSWKWHTASFWCASFPTHIGRVNSLRLVQQAEEFGAVSVDGSGWHRDKSDWDRNYDGLSDWFKGWRNPQMKFSLETQP